MLRTSLATVLIPFLSSLASAQGLYIGPDPTTTPTTAPPTTTRPTIRHPIRRPIRRPAPALIRMKSLRVQATITDGVASTELRQVFRNDGGRIGEGTWILPLPPGATADRFTMKVNGQEMAGEVLDSGKARSIYERIVRSQRDPGLLEYLGTGCLRARIFPIPAQGEVTVLVRYRQVLPETAGLYEWTYPLRAAGVTGGSGSADKVSLDLTIRSRKALKNVYSPMPGVDISRKGDHEARVSLELDKGKRPERDVSVFYGLSDKDFGLNLLTYRKPGEPGYFLMVLAPKQDWPEPENTARSITFVLDTSGSMQGKKIEQARGALTFFLKSLKPKDRFNVVPFSTEARPFFPGPVAADAGNLDRAFAKINEIEARGGTNIEDALHSALTARPPETAGMSYIPVTVFLTDGLPTVGSTDVAQLLAQARKKNTGKSRIFVFGVGHDVNTKLLDKIAEDSRGDRDYVREHENIEVKTGALFTKLSRPVMTNVELACGGIEGYDMFPKRTPDLFVGSRLMVVGRYKGEGQQAIRLKGLVNGGSKEYVFEGSFANKSTDHDFLPVLWAERKVAVLLDAIRLNGRKPELVTEVTRLGKEFGIVTPFTSHLILEEGMRLSQAFGVTPAGGGARGSFFFGADDTVRVERELARAGALPTPPTSGRPAAAGETFKRAARESRNAGKKAKKKLAALDKTAVGKGAVDESLALRSLSSARQVRQRGFVAGRRGKASSGATNLLTRRIKDRTFYLAGGVWIDARYRAGMKDKSRKIEAFSAEYFALLRKHPGLAPYLAFSTKIVVVLDGEVIEIV